MHFIISTSDDEYNHVFAIDKSGLKRIRVEYADHLCPDEHGNFKFAFPWELVEKCLLKLLDYYIRTRNYSFAIELLSINKPFMIAFYNRYFKTASLNHRCSILGFHSRLSAMFHLLYDIWFTLQETEQPCFEIEVPPYKGIDSYYPWNYEGNIDIFQYHESPAIVVGKSEIEYSTYRTGPLSTDIVLLAGKFKDGILKSTFCRTPAIYLRFITLYGELLPIYEHVRGSREWFAFGLLLRKGLGYSAAILIEVRASVNLPDSTVFTENILIEL
jgi:hypothetical protein